MVLSSSSVDEEPFSMSFNFFSEISDLLESSSKENLLCFQAVWFS